MILKQHYDILTLAIWHCKKLKARWINLILINYKMSIAEFVPVYFSNHFQGFKNKHFIKNGDCCLKKKTFLYL